MIHDLIDRFRHASPSFWRGVCVLGVFFISAFWVLAANATWKPSYGESPAAVQQWFRSAEIMPAARARLGVYTCCEQAERLMTKFVGTGTEWSYYPDPNCTHNGCALLPIPNDVVHEEPIRAIDPKDDDLPEFQAMRSEGVLFIWNGKPTCFWPPEGGI
jgi:hypothetical protein